MLISNCFFLFKNALTELRHCLKPVNNLMEEVNTDIDEAKEKEDVLVANQKYCEWVKQYHQT